MSLSYNNDWRGSNEIKSTITPVTTSSYGKNCDSDCNKDCKEDCNKELRLRQQVKLTSMINYKSPTHDPNPKQYKK